MRVCYKYLTQTILVRLDQGIVLAVIENYQYMILTNDNFGILRVKYISIHQSNLKTWFT